MASRLLGQGSQKLMYIRSASPGANMSRSPAASPLIKRTFSSPRSFTRSMAIIMASGTFSRATIRVSGRASAVSAVKRPLPQPSSSCKAEKPGKRSRQRPRYMPGSSIINAAHFSMRGARFGLFLILIGELTLLPTAYHNREKTSINKYLREKRKTVKFPLEMFKKMWYHIQALEG